MIYGVGLCAGSGMLDLAVETACQWIGWKYRTVVYCEREASAAARLVARMEDAALEQAFVCDSFEDVDESFRGQVDCVVAGIPCQGNSMAGKRLLEKDSRNLWPNTRDLLRRVEPELFFLENVSGILVPGKGGSQPAPCARIVGELAEDGWYAEWISVLARDVGANHKRERWFLLAYRKHTRQRSTSRSIRTERRNDACRCNQGMERATIAKRGGG